MPENMIKAKSKEGSHGVKQYNSADSKMERKKIKGNLHNHLLHTKWVPWFYFQFPHIRESYFRPFPRALALYTWKKKHLLTLLCAQCPPTLCA